MDAMAAWAAPESKVIARIDRKTSLKCEETTIAFDAAVLVFAVTWTARRLVGAAPPAFGFFINHAL